MADRVRGRASQACWRAMAWASLGLLAPLFVSASPADAAPPVPRRPVFFAPLKLDRKVPAEEEVLRALLSSGMMRTGKYAQTVTAETEASWKECIREVNREANAETCWVRLGQGQGADLLVAGKVKRQRASCVVIVDLTELETRMSVRQHVGIVKPCGRERTFLWVPSPLVGPILSSPWGSRQANSTRCVIFATGGSLGGCRHRVALARSPATAHCSSSATQSPSTHVPRGSSESPV